MIAFEWNETLQEIKENFPVWQVTLSDGRIVYQAGEDSEAWKALYIYLDTTSLRIVKMHIGFRGNCIPLPDNADGYFFRCSVLATYDWNKKSFIVGILKGGILELDRYEVPEMIHVEHEQRSTEDAGMSLIS